MNSYRPYPTYKSSGIDWFGDLPEHWEMRRLKFLASIVYSNVDKHSKTGEVPVKLCNYVDVYKNEQIVDSLDFMEATADLGEIKKFGLRKGDIIITKDSEEWSDIAVPAYVPFQLDNVVCGYHLALVRHNPDLMDGEFLFRAFASQAINYQFQVAASGVTRYGLGKQALGDALFVVPPIYEQRAIAAFLDREIAHIDSLIAKKRELIDLLSHQRSAIISHAVTKGLNPTAPMKSSGVEWIGYIPDKWQIIKLKFIASLRYGLGQPPPESPDGIPFIRATNINSGQITKNQMLFVINTPTISARQARLHKDEIIVVRSGAYTGDSAIIPAEYENAIAGYDMVVRVKKGISKFIAWQILSPLVRNYQFGFSKLRAAQPHLNAEELGNTLIVLPPLPEQSTIADFLDRETARIDELIIQIEESITLLQKQRIALISAAVTGKIDVREQGM